MTSIEQKNKNILSRFENKTEGTNARKYTVHFKDGKKCQMVCMNGETLEQATKSCRGRFLERFSHVQA